MRNFSLFLVLTASLGLTQLACGDGGESTGAAPNSDTSASQVSDGIETVVIDSRPISTGLLTLQDPFPVLLFRDGSACFDMNFVAQNLDAAAHRLANPAKWTEWKRMAGKIALLKSGTWRVLSDDDEFPPRARGFELDGVFRHVSSYSLGTIASVQERFYHFSPGHRFVEMGDALFSTGNGSGGSISPNQQGTYEIGGYVLRLRSDSGLERVTSLVSGASDPTTIYVGGTWYSLDSAR